MTNKQKQCLLCYLGYYEGSIDGVFGEQTKKATKAFQEDYGLIVDGVFGKKTEERILNAVNGEAIPVDFWDSIRYFKKEEFKCRCAGKHCNGFPAEPTARLVRLADKVRTHFGAPAIVSSGVRCESHNTKVGGVANSRHKSGKAMDFCIRGKSAQEVLAYVKSLPEVRYAYAIENSSYIHMDVQ